MSVKNKTIRPKEIDEKVAQNKNIKADQGTILHLLGVDEAPIRFSGIGVESDRPKKLHDHGAKYTSLRFGSNDDLIADDHVTRWKNENKAGIRDLIISSKCW
uniref:Uncharacterized protein n=1 Tax=Romanomermis culicivorax TaxID=13658 RepID=A0A915J2W6_ROMCU